MAHTKKWLDVHQGVKSDNTINGYTTQQWKTASDAFTAHLYQGSDAPLNDQPVGPTPGDPTPNQIVAEINKQTTEGAKYVSHFVSMGMLNLG